MARTMRSDGMGHQVPENEARQEQAATVGTGWFGMARQVEHYLDVVGADRDAQGKFMVGGSVVLGLDGEEMVIGHDAYYLAGGERKNLAAGLRSTSYGMGVVVIA